MHILKERYIVQNLFSNRIIMVMDYTQLAQSLHLNLLFIPIVLINISHQKQFNHIQEAKQNLN